MNKLLVCTVIVILLASASFAAQQNLQGVSHLKKQPQMMYVQTAQAGSFDGGTLFCLPALLEISA